MQRIIQHLWFKFPSTFVRTAYFQVKRDSKENLLKLLIVQSIFSLIFSVIPDIKTNKVLNSVMKFLVLVMCLLIWRYGSKIKKIRDMIMIVLPIGLSIWIMLQIEGGLSYYDSFDVFHFVFSVGIMNKVTKGGHPDFWTKLILTATTLITRFVIVPPSSSYVTFVEVAVVLIDLLGEVWREKDGRCLFKKYYDYREELTKFKNLLVSGLPVNISILSRDLRRTLFVNECFKASFKTNNPINSSEDWDPADYFSDFAVEKESLSFGDTFFSDLNHYQPSLLYMLQKFCEIYFQGENENHYCFVVKNQAMTDSNPKIFEVKAFTFIWDGEDAIAIILNDATQQYTNIALRVADTNKDKMISMVSHELRTPLNGILGMVSILEKQITDAQMLECLSVCKNSGKLLLSLVNSILDLGQIRNNKLKLAITSGNLKDLMNEIFLLFEFQFKEKGLFLKLDMADPNIPEAIVTDLNRLKQILINLIGNALKFTFQGGVQVSVFVDENYEGELFFSVSDSGVGIKKEDQRKLFKMYGRLDQLDGQNSEGVGLGLTISNHLVRLLSGQEDGIKVESEYEKGTTFAFSIRTDYNKYKMVEHDIRETEGDEHSHDQLAGTPTKILNYVPKRSQFSFELGSTKKQRKSSSPKGKDIQSTFKNFKRRNKKRYMHYLNPSSPEIDRGWDLFLKEIQGKGSDFLEQGNRLLLVIDDSPFNIMVARHLLENLGYKVEAALNGKLGVEKVKEYSSENKKFALIFMDLQMPVMDGYEATKVLCGMMERGEIKRIQIIALSANDTENDKQRCRDGGMVDHLSKPIDEARLRMVLKRYTKES